MKVNKALKKGELFAELPDLEDIGSPEFALQQAHQFNTPGFRLQFSVRAV